MAINFPTSPALNDTVTDGTTTWVCTAVGPPPVWGLVPVAGGGGATGGGTDEVFYENDQTVTTNYTITTNKNAVTAGPVTVDSGVTVTVPSGSVWVVV